MLTEERHYSDAPPVNFDELPELAGFTNEPPAMYVGCPGKHGYLNLVFETAENGKSVMTHHDRRSPLIVQRALYVDEELPGMPCVYILSAGGPNVDGDRYGQDFHLKEGAMAFITTVAATKLAEMRHNYSGMKQTIILDKNSYLEYLPQPLIPCKHTRYISDTRIIIHPEAAMFYSEIYMPGRKYYKDGERFEYDVLSICTHAERPDGEPLFREKFIIEPARGYIRQIGVMQDFDVFGNVIVLAPQDAANRVYDACEPAYDKQKKIARGVTRLPNNAGLLFKALGMEPGPVKEEVRNFCSLVRKAVKGRPLPKEFAWR